METLTLETSRHINGMDTIVAQRKARIMCSLGTSESPREESKKSILLSTRKARLCKLTSDDVATSMNSDQVVYNYFFMGLGDMADTRNSFNTAGLSEWLGAAHGIVLRSSKGVQPLVHPGWWRTKTVKLLRTDIPNSRMAGTGVRRRYCSCRHVQVSA